jgi:hypothetical protein
VLNKEAFSPLRVLGFFIFAPSLKRAWLRCKNEKA